MNRENFLNELKQICAKSCRMILCGHVRPDGDSIGACIAFAHQMVRQGCHPMIYFEGDTSRFPWLTVPKAVEGIEILHSQEDLHKATMGRFTFVMLDVASPDRAGEAGICMDLCEYSVCIDHHVNHGEYADINLIVPTASAASEILWGVFHDLDWPLDEIDAMALFTGIAFDTGGFRHSNMTPQVFSIAADLASHQVPVTPIMNGLFHTRSFTEQKVLGAILGKAKLYCRGQIVLSQMDKTDFLKMGASANDCEGAVALLAETSGAEVAVFMRELEPKAGQAGQKSQIRINLRAKEWVDVSEVALRFGGGGHRKAAGCTICEPILLAKQMILDAIRDQMGDAAGEDKETEEA